MEIYLGKGVSIFQAGLRLQKKKEICDVALVGE